MSLTSIVIVKNEEEVIGDCLSSIGFCEEIIVVDNGSTDRTQDIARKFGARVVEVKANDFSRLRDEGLKQAKSEWVLYVDADERVSGDLAEEIENIIKKISRHKAYRVKRKNFYFGKKEWPQTETLERLFKKKHLKGWYGKIHESPQVDGEVGELKNYLLHYTHRDLTQMLNKTIEWSEIEADTRFRNNHPKMNWWRFPRVMISAFFDSYYKQKGYKAGTAGLIESIYQSFSIFITYAKLWEKQIEVKK